MAQGQPVSIPHGADHLDGTFRDSTLATDLTWRAGPDNNLLKQLRRFICAVDVINDEEERAIRGCESQCLMASLGTHPRMERVEHCLERICQGS
jgi:hypothetical protein